MKKNSSFNRKRGCIKFVALLGCLAIVFSCTLAVSFTNIQNGGSLDNIAGAAIDLSHFATLNSSYNALAHKSKYTFTDKSKVNSFRSGSISSDTTTITVDRTQPHGSQENPYVIDSINGNSNGKGSWNAFVSAMGNSANSYGAGKYFVLANDLDWNSGAVTFNQVARFDGNLYGLGHTFKNITKDFGHNGANSSGIIDVFNSGIIADLSLSDCRWTKVWRGGGFVDEGNGTFLNCHANGTISNDSSSPSPSAANDFGGIIRHVNSGFMAYRCSVNWTTNMYANTVNGAANGCFIADSTGSFDVYDCYGSLDISTTNPRSDIYTGAVVGIPYFGTDNITINIENVYSSIYHQDINRMSGDHFASILAGYHTQVANNDIINFSNVYVDARFNKNGVVTMMPLSNHIPSQDYRRIIVNTSNINYVSGYAAYSPLSGSSINDKIPASSATAHSNTSALVNAAQAETHYSLWDTGKIGATYSVSDNPVINKSLNKSSYTANFYNLKNGNKEAISGIPASDTYSYGVTNSVFPTPSDHDGHKFAGWLLDDANDQSFYAKGDRIPSDLMGDVDFYAVWDVDAMTSEKLTLENNNTEYLLNKVKLISDISFDKMSDAVIDYEWTHDGNDTGNTADMLELSEVADSGAYTLSYYIRSQSEPLWRHRGSLSETVKINPGKLTPQSMTVDKTAYYGMPLSGLVPTVVMHDSKGQVVTGKAHWAISLGKVNKDETDPKYQQGKAYAEFYFVPDSSYNGNYVSGNAASGGVNYNTSATDVADVVYFAAEAISVKFATAAQLGSDLTFELDIYGNTLSYSRIAAEFDRLFAQFCTDNSDLLNSLGISGYTPQLKLDTDGKFYNINDYRTKPGGYSNVTQSITIDVNFAAATYSVTYKFADEANTPDKVETGKTYGQLLLKPAPDPTNGAQMFLGWYYPEKDANGNPVLEPNGNPKLKRWDFDVDRVVGDLVLTARWLKAETLDHIEVVPNKPSYSALSPLGAGDLTVTAFYTAKDGEGNNIIIPVVLEWSEYQNKIQYVGNRPGDNVLHVAASGARTQITVGFSYFNNGQMYTDSKTVDIVVDPVKIDLSELNLETKIVVFDGTAKSYDLITLSQIQNLTNPDAGFINGIEFTYYLGRDEVAPDDVIAIGNYSVTVSFTTSDIDYVVDALTVQLRIVDESENPNPNPGGNDGSGNNEPGGNAFIDFFKKLIESNFPLWQVATSAVALLLTLIFMIKSIQYGNRKKKAKGEAKKYNAKTYAALLPIFSTQAVWLNLSNMIWSIIAFSLCGVMLLMFLTMVITRKGWKKAELAKETAIEESEQRKTEAMEAKQQAREEAQENRQRELQQTLALATQGGQLGGDSSVFEEMLRQRDEAHRREMEEREERYRQEMERRDEEQAKRDEAMKMMFANLMGRQQADGMAFASMEDTDLIADKVFERLLPAVQQMLPESTAYLTAPEESSDNLDAIADRVAARLLPSEPAESSEEMRAMSAKIDVIQQQLAMIAQNNAPYAAAEREDDDDLDDDEEEWDSILDEDDDDFVEAVIIEEDGTVKKTYPNFRMRLKQSSDKNREWYAAVKNLFCSQKGVTYRVYKRVEKIRYQGQVIAVIGIAKRSIKLWLALKPYEYDARRYHHKDVSDKPRFVDVPMYVRVSSDRALTRAQELILALFQELNMEARKRYNDRSIQELIFTLKHNKLLTNKQNKGLLCEVMHVHDCDVLSDELAEKCIESKNVENIDESLIETIKLDDIDAKFQDGNRVTLEKLKKVGLVSEECTGYTVTAGQRITKPLIIVANDFTLPAVKMITLTGGRAIKINKI